MMPNAMHAFNMKICLEIGFSSWDQEAFISLKSRSYGYMADSNDNSPKLLVTVEN